MNAAGSGLLGWVRRGPLAVGTVRQLVPMFSSMPASRRFSFTRTLSELMISTSAIFATSTPARAHLITGQPPASG